MHYVLKYRKGEKLNGRAVIFESRGPGLKFPLGYVDNSKGTCTLSFNLVPSNLQFVSRMRNIDQPNQIALCKRGWMRYNPLDGNKLTGADRRGQI